MTDLISRQDAIDALAKFVPYAICDESTESYTNGLTDAYNLICQLPSAEPVRHGKWMGTVCSACGASVSFYYDCDYCPCCGARMNEDERN